MRVKRLDFASLDASKLQRTPSGGIVVPACVTRTGVFTYQTSDGRTIREYRPRSEVGAETSLQSLANAPVTVRHPTGEVTAENWSSLAKGSVVAGSPLLVQGPPDLLNANLAIQDAKTVALVLSKELVEISCGYSCDLLEQSGVSPEGEAYDRVQTNITYNHVALGPTGWGRAGEICSVKLDSKGDLWLDSTYLPKEPGKARRYMKHQVSKKGSILRVDGVEFNLRTPEGRANGERALTNIVESYSVNIANIRKDDAADAIAMLENVLNMLKSMVTPMAEPAPEQAAMDADSQPAPDPNAAKLDPNAPDAKAKDAEQQAQDVEARADERFNIIEKARLLDPKVETKGKKNAEIMRAALAKHGVRVDGSEERLRGAFDAFPVQTKPAQHPSLHHARGPVVGEQPRTDGEEGLSVEEQFRNNAANAWRKGKK